MTIRSSAWQPALQPVAGVPAIARLAARLRAHLDLPVFAVCQAAGDAAALAGTAGCDVVAAEGPDRVSVLRRFCAEQGIGTVAVFARDAILPDCERTRRMLAQHRDEAADATFGTLYPPGLLPEVLDARVLDGLDVSPGEALALWPLLRDRGGFKLSQLARDHRAEPVLERLPSTVLLLTPAARLAAASVRDAGPGCRPAIEFGDALRRIEETTDPVVPPPRNPRARRVLFVTMADLYAGAEESLFQLVSNIGDGRYEPLVLLPDHGELRDRVERAGIATVHHLLDPRPHNPATDRWFDRLLDLARPALVHVDCAPLASLAIPAMRRGIPVIYHVRTLLGRAAPEIMKFASRAIAVSEAARLDLLRSGLDPVRVTVVPNALDLSGFDRARYDRTALREAAGIDRDAFVVLMVARISRQKRQDFVVAAMPEMLRRVPHLHLALAGEVYSRESGYAESLRTEISRLGLAGRVHFLGFVPETGQAYAMADALVLATEVEAFGRCVIEAMAMGLPVVAPDAAGPAEIVTHGENGMLFPPRDRDALVRCVSAIAEDGALAQRLTVAGLARVRDFSIAAHVERLRAIYDEVAG